MSSYAQRDSIQRARVMRKDLTPPEARLWQALRGRKLDGLKFRRQHPIGPFVLDFFCSSLGLVVEVDGTIHDFDDGPARDERRDLWLERRGLTIVRIPAHAVRDNLDGVLTLISQRARYASSRVAEAPCVTPSRDAPPGGGREAGGWQRPTDVGGLGR